MSIDTPISEVTFRISQHRTWLPFGFSSEVIIEGNVKKFRLPEIIDASLSIFWPHLVSQSELIDLKGCDAARGGLFSSTSNQLLWIRGEIPLENGQNEGFSLSVETPFKAFSGVHHISHSVQTHRTSEFMRELSIAKLGRIFPLRTLEFRFGIERFKSKRTFPMLGFVPTVSDGFNLEVRNEKLRLTIFNDYHRGKSSEVIEGEWLETALGQLCRRVAGPEWRRELKEKSV